MGKQTTIGASKLTESKVEIIRQLLESGDHTHQQIADLYNVCRSTITKINLGERWNPEVKSFIMKSDKVYREFSSNHKPISINRITIELSNGQRFDL